MRHYLNMIGRLVATMLILAVAAGLSVKLYNYTKGTTNGCKESEVNSSNR